MTRKILEWFFLEDSFEEVKETGHPVFCGDLAVELVVESCGGAVGCWRDYILLLNTIQILIIVMIVMMTNIGVIILIENVILLSFLPFILICHICRYIIESQGGAIWLLLRMVTTMPKNPE